MLKLCLKSDPPRKILIDNNITGIRMEKISIQSVSGQPLKKFLNFHIKKVDYENENKGFGEISPFDNLFKLKIVFLN